MHIFKHGQNSFQEPLLRIQPSRVKKDRKESPNLE